MSSELTLNDLKILSTLYNQRRYGYDIVRTVEDAGGRIYLGSLYNILYKLEDRGFINSSIDKNASVNGRNNRRYYELTDLGRSVFNKEKRTFSRLVQIPNRHSKSKKSGEGFNG